MLESARERKSALDLKSDQLRNTLWIPPPVDSKNGMPALPKNVFGRFHTFRFSSFRCQNRDRDKTKNLPCLSVFACTAPLQEILLWLTGYFKYRAATASAFFSLYASMPTGGWLLTVVYFINYLVPFTAKCTNFLLTLNRFTLVRYNAITHIRVGSWSSQGVGY